MAWGTDMKKSRYYIPKHRFLELKHFCLQYPTFIKNYMLLTEGIDIKSIDPTSERAVAISEYRRATMLIERSANGDTALLEQVTTGKDNGKDRDSVMRFYYILSVNKGLL